MKMQIKLGGGVPFARKEDYEWENNKYEADLKNGDIVKILDSGNEEQGTYGTQFNFKIKTRNGEKKTGFNQSTVNVLVQEFGDETENWVGKDVKVLLKKDIVAGKKVTIAYFVAEGWSLDEYGDLLKNKVINTLDDVRNSLNAPNNEPQEEITVDQIPF